MKSVSGKKLAKILEQNSWQLARVKGSHHRYRKENTNISLPIHANEDLKLGILKSIMKQANLTEEDLI
jgi:predicted RNA binding protein YcfA (HicA-like mRNA interferase family)